MIIYFPIIDANSNYGNSTNRPHSHQLDFQNGSSNELWHQSQYKMGKFISTQYVLSSDCR